VGKHKSGATSFREVLPQV